MISISVVYTFCLLSLLPFCHLFCRLFCRLFLLTFWVLFWVRSANDVLFWVCSTKVCLSAFFEYAVQMTCFFEYAVQKSVAFSRGWGGRSLSSDLRPSYESAKNRVKSWSFFAPSGSSLVKSVLHAAFTRKDRKSAKRQSSH